jgi:hypothetical protein
MAELFGTKRPAITKHLGNIFKVGELEQSSVCSILNILRVMAKFITLSFILLKEIVE